MERNGEMAEMEDRRGREGDGGEVDLPMINDK